MKALFTVLTALILLTSAANADEAFIGAWSSGAKEVLKISKEGDSLTAEFVRENVKRQFEKVRFPAKLQDGALVISGEQGDLSARYDEGNKILILGGMKAFQKLTDKQAQTIISNLEKKQ